MVITAKFGSVCPRCSLPIAIGSMVEWSKGSPAHHVACAGRTASSAGTAGAYLGKVSVAARTARPARGEWYGRRTGCRCGSIEGSPRDSDCRQCQYDNE